MWSTLHTLVVCLYSDVICQVETAGDMYTSVKFDPIRQSMRFATVVSHLDHVKAFTQKGQNQIKPR